MKYSVKIRIAVLACILGVVSSAMAQQKPQWMPGQVGLNAGVLPSPGFTYVNMDINYDAGAFNGPNGNAIPATGTYNVWAVENIFYYVFPTKFLGGNIGLMAIFPTVANGSLVADFQVPAPGGPTNLVSLEAALDSPIYSFNRLAWAGT